MKPIDITVPLIALAAFAALVGFWWLIDNGFPTVWPL